MSTSLPERPDLAQLRRQAKELRDAARHGDPGAAERFARHHPKATQGVVTVATAQLVIAREAGFASWPRLKAAVDAQATSPERLAGVFLAASIEGRAAEAESVFDAVPDIARYRLEAAAVLGDAERVGERLAVDPAAAVAIDEVRGWPPLLYACYSRWHQIDPGRAAGMAEVVRLLLDAGASPNTNNGARQGYRSALKGSVELNNPDVVRVLLQVGANPDQGRPVAAAAGLRDHRCLELLLAHGARVVAGTWTVGAAVYADDAHAVSILLDAMESADGGAAREATEALTDGAAEASADVVAALLAAGADAAANDGDRGMSALRRAVRAGRSETVALLVSHGAPDDSTDVDHFIGASWRADRRAAEQLLAEHPDLRDRHTDEDRAAAVVEAAGSALVSTVGLMLDLGFSPNARNGSGEQPLHAAAYAGNADTVRLLIHAGADVDGRDTRFDATPLAFATVGSGERAGQGGNWVEVVRSLVDAGASRDGVWISGKPPSEEVMDLLRGFGITPDAEPESGPDDEDGPDPSLGAGVMADVARHLEAAYRNLDLELLGSLLDPEVHWTGVCTTSGEVLDWYRSLLADGMRSTVDSVEADGDAVVLGLSVARQAEGARPASPEQLYQVFTIDNARVIGIHVYPDRASALTRPARARPRGTT
ncbi:MAG: ankyrin repeat domain-containing protein [Acidimicrobiales bacterium]